MGRASAQISGGRRSLLLLWTFIVIIGLAVTMMAGSVSEGVAASALLGSTGTYLVLVGVLIAVIFGVGVAMRRDGVSVLVRRSTALLLWMAAGITALLAFGFFADGEYPGVGILLIQSAVFIALIGRRAHPFHETRG